MSGRCRRYECEHCGNQVYPTAGTPFAQTRTSLRDWFFVMFLFCSTRNGAAAKEVQRQLGVTYKTAWRMCRLIRLYMGQVDGDDPVGGHGKTVEADETFIGGKDKQGEDDKAVVLGVAERGGDVVTRHIADRSARNIAPNIVRYVKAGSRINTDEWTGYNVLTERHGFEVETVNHSAEEYVRGDIHTNNIEAFWRQVKRGIEGTYVWVSKKHLQTHLREFEYRHNLRHQPALMFELLLQAFAPVRLEKP